MNLNLAVCQNIVMFFFEFSFLNNTQNCLHYLILLKNTYSLSIRNLYITYFFVGIKTNC